MWTAAFIQSAERDFGMDQDRVKGKSKVVIGGIKTKAGEVTGNGDLKANGKAERTEGKVQGAFGKVKDAARDFSDPAKDGAKR
jgi:uncharacterized protein YjbJ (UPF0337 family)